MRIVGIVLAFVSFIMLVLGHEFGHFSVGKLLGFKINEFSVGMGPQLWGKTKGETEYSLRAIPIGGYCAFEGEEDGSEDPRSFNRQKPWKKLLVLVAGSFNNIVIGIIIFTVVFAIAGAYSPVLSEGKAGAHKIQGIGAGFVPDVLNTKVYDEIFKAEGDDAFAAAKLLAKKEGISVGISSGAALHGAIELAKRPENKGKVIVALLPDSGDRYYSTALFTD